MVKVTKFDAVQYLDSEEMMTAYLEAAMEDQNPDVFLAVLAGTPMEPIRGHP